MRERERRVRRETERARVCERARERRDREREGTLSRGMCEKRSLMMALDLSTTLLNASIDFCDCSPKQRLVH